MAIYTLLAALGSALITSGKDEVNQQIPGQAQGSSPGSSAQSIFSQQQPTPKAQPLGPIDPGQNDQLATTLALLGDAPKAPTQPSNPSSATPTSPTAPTGNPATPAAAKQPSVGEILAASSQALGQLAPLFFNQGNKKTIVTGGAAGGPQGQVVQGFQLPQRQTLGQILAGLPR